RRRHTSSKRDWSSDVCSSDLIKTPLLYKEPYRWQCKGLIPFKSVFKICSAVRQKKHLFFPIDNMIARQYLSHNICETHCTLSDRSEERRVGKGGSWQWESMGS